MKAFPFLSIFVLLLNTASGTYEPWEDIKMWYDEYHYDRTGAETREITKENECLGLNGNSTGFCFDECMFRIGYSLILLNSTGKDHSTYGINREKGVRYLEQEILRANLTEKPEHFWYDNGRRKGLRHTTLVFHLKYCAEWHRGFVFFPAKLKGNRTGKNSCYAVYQEDQQKKIKELVTCLKSRIKKPEIPGSTPVSTVKQNRNHNNSRTKL